MEEILIEDYKFIEESLDKVEIIFSTAENDLDFNKDTEEGRKNLDNIKRWFNVEEVGFVNQVHGDAVIIYDKSICEADALITNLRNTAIGVFTADCVPILLYDQKNNVIAAVHSGWKGTLVCILLKAIEKMEKNFGTRGENLLAFVGPHNRQCCYEVGEEVILKFKNSEIYKNLNLFNGRNLSLINCIKHQLTLKNVNEANIHDLDVCTFCNGKYPMHSYRKDKRGGRMFSFIRLK
ncbi:peptidoglycan editing factor PgeF [Clostridiaceae bacterium UIB06]|uniref:Purine nucleoside phosphorylase n=1 Tax=Clostridium thailandense TaxID=2794346 RepID=A0A949TUZ3_9CLOT|nr:peptidoglycan editing factor PgeF [Clostridium thailandense]MBV7271915.1 peptidoglycan editing factor PgeF [Clostridium thailandense]MCH5137141.1 peptidoglycan editing factor PgeF [Clostridiaceae bacterium UIB06]